MLQVCIVIYYIFAYTAYVPMIARLLQTKSSHDYSLVETAMTGTATFLFLVYAVGSGLESIFILGAVVDVILQAWLVFLIFKYHGCGGKKNLP